MVFARPRLSRAIFASAVLISAVAFADEYNDAMKRANAAMVAGNSGEAAMYYEEALKATRPGDMREFLALEGLARVAEKTGRVSDAEALYLRGLNSRRRSGPVFELPALLDLSYFYRRQKRWADQISVLQRLVEIWTHTAGPDVPGAAQYETEIGQAQMRLENYGDAAESFRSAMTTLKANSDTDPLALAHVTGLLAHALGKEGRTDDADALCRDTLKQLKAAPADRVPWDELARQYVQFLKENGRSAEADELNKQLPPDESELHLNRTKPRLISKEDPAYSDKARKLHLGGTVLVRLSVGEDGLPHDIHVLEPLGLGLDQKAVAAVGKWRFEPGTADGKPVPVSATIEINFRLL